MTSDPDVVRFFDTTLRDGEQAPGIALTKDEKVEIAEQLARLHVDILEAGFAISSDGEFDAVREIATSVKGPVIASLARVVPGDIERAAAALKGAERFRIHVFISTSQIHMDDMLRMSHQQVLDADRGGHAARRRLHRRRRVQRAGRDADGAGLPAGVLRRRREGRRDDDQRARTRWGTPLLRSSASSSGSSASGRRMT